MKIKLSYYFLIYIYIYIYIYIEQTTIMNNIRVNILTYLTEEHHVQAALLQLVKSAHWLYPRTAIRTKAHGGVERSFLVWRLVRWEMVVLTVQRKRCCRSR
jgi:hypothetical protein